MGTNVFKLHFWNFLFVNQLWQKWCEKCLSTTEGCSGAADWTTALQRGRSKIFCAFVPLMVLLIFLLKSDRTYHLIIIYFRNGANHCINYDDRRPISTGYTTHRVNRVRFGHQSRVSQVVTKIEYSRLSDGETKS